MTLLLNISLGITITLITLWGVGALYFSPLLPAQWRAFAARIYSMTHPFKKGGRRAKAPGVEATEEDFKAPAGGD